MRAALALLLSACHAPAAIARIPQPHPHVDTPPRPVHVEDSTQTISEHDLLANESRPTLRATLEIDPQTLPLATWGPPRKDSWLSFFRGVDGTSRFHVEGVSFAEVRAGNFIGFTGELDGFANDAWPECGTGSPRAAVWRGISIVDWSDANVSIVMSRGELDGVSCVAKASTTLSGRAAAIVPRYVYALRFDRSVYVVMPGGALAVASDGQAGHGSFSSVVLPLEAHHERAAALRVSSFGLARWRGMPQLKVSLLHDDVAEAPTECPLVTIEVRERGDRLVLALSVATADYSSAASELVAAIEARARRAQ